MHSCRPQGATLRKVRSLKPVSYTHLDVYKRQTYFTAETLSKEAASAGFKVLNVFGDMAGNPGTDESQTLAILLEK